MNYYFDKALFATCKTAVLYPYFCFIKLQKQLNSLLCRFQSNILLFAFFQMITRAIFVKLYTQWVHPSLALFIHLIVILPRQFKNLKGEIIGFSTFKYFIDNWFENVVEAILVKKDLKSYSSLFWLHQITRIE